MENKLDTSDISWIISGKRYGVVANKYMVHGAPPSYLRRRTFIPEYPELDTGYGCLDAVTIIPTGSVVQRNQDGFLARSGLSIPIPMSGILSTLFRHHLD